MSFPPNLSVIVTKIYLPSLGVEANLNQSYWILTKTSKYSKCFLALLFAVQGSHICRKCSLVAVFALLPPWWSSYHLFTKQPPAHRLEIDEAAASLGHFYQSNLRKLLSPRTFLLYRNECLGLKVHSIEMLTCIASLNIENLALVFAMITVSWYDIILHPSPIMFDKSALQLCYLTIARPIIAVWVWF